MTDRLSTLRLFATIVELRSISAAARAHGISTTTGSRRMQELEAELGATLLDRTTRSLAPTEAGQRLLDRIAAPLNTLATALREAGETQTEPCGTLRVLARRSYAMRHVRPILPEFLKANPLVTVDLELTERVDIAPGDAVDIVIRLGNPHEKSLIARRLASDDRILCASPGYISRHGSPTEIEDLTRHACLTYRRAHEAARWVFEQGRDRNRVSIAIDGPLRATNGEVLRDGALADLGIVLLPGWMVADDVEAGRLVRLLPEFRAWPAGFNDEIFIAYRRSEHTPAKITAFVEALAPASPGGTLQQPHGGRRNRESQSRNI
jgi:DNA-binding transcriptional LysR family regulator